MPSTKCYTKVNIFNPNSNLKIAHFTDEKIEMERLKKLAQGHTPCKSSKSVIS